MTDYHEPAQELSEKTRNFVRAIHSLMEELEAVDWYSQRIDLIKDKELKNVLTHNRDEEIEHACMTLEWLRRHMDGWDENLKTYLFTEGEITDEHGDDGESTAESSDESNDLAIGKL